jgi:hypothetical protein
VAIGTVMNPPVIASRPYSDQYRTRTMNNALNGDGLPHPDGSGFAMTKADCRRRKNTISISIKRNIAKTIHVHGKERSDVAIYAESSKSVKMDRRVPTGRASR